MHKRTSKNNQVSPGVRSSNSCDKKRRKLEKVQQKSLSSGASCTNTAGPSFFKFCKNNTKKLTEVVKKGEFFSRIFLDIFVMEIVTANKYKYWF